jgi:hypothetical protein
MELISFEENFKDNSNEWLIGNNEVFCCEVSNGKYFLEHKRESNDFAVWKPMPLVESKAYSFEASFTFVQGNTTSGFGFLWGQGQKNGSDEKYNGFHYFIISASGKYVIRSYNPKTKKTEPVKDWTDCSFIKIGDNETNVLKIIKFDDNIDKQLYFLINDQMIFQSNYLPLFGYETGFIAFQNMKIAIDYLKANFYFEPSLINQ